jgi:exodeoxyribonuclease X
MHRYIIFDTETTDVSPEKRAVEFAMLEVDENLNILGDAQALVNPGRPLSPEASAINGITDDMVASCPTVEEWVAQHPDIFPLDGDITLIGHKVTFDAPLFAPFGRYGRLLDTLDLACAFISDAPNRKLDTLKQHLGLPGGGTSHRAMADVLTCYQLLKWFTNHTGRTLHDLCMTPYFLLHYAPWGKWEGTLLMEVPKGYRDWMLSLDGLSPSLRRSLELVALTDVTLQLKPLSKTPRRIIIPRKTK